MDNSAEQPVSGKNTPHHTSADVSPLKTPGSNQQVKGPEEPDSAAPIPCEATYIQPAEEFIPSPITHDDLIEAAPEILASTTINENVSPTKKAKGAVQMAAGATLTAAGIPMLILPGPGAVAVVGGVTLLSKGHRNFSGRQATAAEEKLDDIAGKLAETTKEQTKKAAKQAAAKAPEVAAKAAAKAPEVAISVAQKAPGAAKQVASKTAEIAPQVAKKAVKTAPVVAKKVSEVAPQAAKKVVDTAPKVAGVVAKEAPKVLGGIAKGFAEGLRRAKTNTKDDK